MARVKIALWICVLLFSAGCSSIGTGTITSDRFDYNAAISDSWKDQMLINLVKIRYGDSPVFLDIASVISQYSVEGELRLMTSRELKSCFEDSRIIKQRVTFMPEVLIVVGGSA